MVIHGKAMYWRFMAWWHMTPLWMELYNLREIGMAHACRWWPLKHRLGDRPWPNGRERRRVCDDVLRVRPVLDDWAVVAQSKSGDEEHQTLALWLHDQPRADAEIEHKGESYAPADNFTRLYAHSTGLPGNGIPIASAICLPMMCSRLNGWPLSQPQTQFPDAGSTRYDAPMPKGRDKPTQTTEKGLTIPIPTRKEYMRNLEKVAPKPEPPEIDEKRKKS